MSSLGVLRAGRAFVLLATGALVAAGLVLLAAAGGPVSPGQSPAAAQEPTPAPGHQPGLGADGFCLSCHADTTLTMAFPNGEILPLYLDPDEFQHSVHGTRLTCTDCHRRNLTIPHEVPDVETPRQLAQIEYEACKSCHFDNYTKTLDSMHFDALAEGKEKAPLCTDCHGAHNTTRLTESRTDAAETCSNCHDDVAGEYKDSIHGSQLLEEDNPDVPVCITCHGVHNIESPKTASFRQESVNLCANCHADKKLMAKYDISADVFKTYLDDFHGKTVGFYQEEGSEVWPDVAVCTDCHGVHNIAAVDDPDSSVFKENLASTCGKCHEDATPSFSSAWLSHYEPSLDKAPLVYAVKQYYKYLIPAMLFGLALNIALDLWRLARNR